MTAPKLTAIEIEYGIFQYRYINGRWFYKNLSTRWQPDYDPHKDLLDLAAKIDKAIAKGKRK